MRAHGLPDTAPNRRRVRDRDRKRALRSVGPITSDRRVAFSKAVDAGERMLRKEAAVPARDARTIAVHYLREALPPSQRGRTAA